jgi:hypothetical protein
MPHWSDPHIKKLETPMGVVRSCRVPGCKFFVFRRKFYGSGRGEGFREGNKQRGALIQHLKTAHPELVPDKEKTP